MAKKRPTIRGKGADLYLTPPAQGQEPPPAEPAPSPSPTPGPQEKITFSLPADLANRLEDAWLTLRKRDRKRFTKQAILAAALAEALDEHDKNPETSSLITRLAGKP